MKNRILYFFLVAVTCLIGASRTPDNGSNYKNTDSKENDMKLSGTSTLHDWEMHTSTFTGDASFEFEKSDPRAISTLTSLNFALEVLYLKSDNKGLDKNAYKALKTDQFKEIKFTLISASILSHKENNYLMTLNGKLSIAGVTKTVDIEVHNTVNKDGSIRCTGSEKLMMTDYNVEPPSFMFGAMSTGDAITLDFNFVFKT